MSRKEMDRLYRRIERVSGVARYYRRRSIAQIWSRLFA